MIKHAYRLICLPMKDIREIPKDHPNYLNLYLKWRELEVFGLQTTTKGKNFYLKLLIIDDFIDMKLD